MEVGRAQAPLPIERRIAGRQLGGELAELGCRAGRPARGRLLGCGVQLGGDDGVRAVRGQRQVAGPLLDVRDRTGERSVHGTALPERRALVADRGEQRMREADASTSSSSTTASSRRRLERLQNALPLTVGRRHELDRRPRERGHQQQDVERLAGQAREAAAEQLAQALGHAQRLAGRRPRARPDELAAELEREERVARGRLLHACELRPRQLEPEPLLEQVMERRPG